MTQFQHLKVELSMKLLFRLIIGTTLSSRRILFYMVLSRRFVDICRAQSLHYILFLKMSVSSDSNLLKFIPSDHEQRMADY